MQRGGAADGQCVQLGEFGGGRGEADRESIDFAEPSLLAGFGYPGLQVVADAGQPGALGGVRAQQGAAEQAFSWMHGVW